MPLSTLKPYMSLEHKRKIIACELKLQQYLQRPEAAALTYSVKEDLLRTYALWRKLREARDPARIAYLLTLPVTLPVFRADGSKGYRLE